MKNKYGESMYPTDDGRWVPWYISNLMEYGNSVIPRREGLTAESILKDYGLKVRIRESEMTTLSTIGSSVSGRCLIGEIVDKE